MKPCPVCGEKIQDVAIKCRFCGEIFDPEIKRQQQARGEVPAYKKLIFALVWWFVLFIGSRMVAGGIVGGMAGAREPDNAQLAAVRDAEAFFAKWNTTLLVASGVIATLGAGLGVLPGTRRRKGS